jgi:hypothetical protein
MTEAPVYTLCVSQTAGVGFTDAAANAQDLAGRDFVAGPYRLHVSERLADGFDDARRFSGSLHFDGPLVRHLEVEVMVSPWSADQSEIAIRPVSHLGHPESHRTKRFLQAAWSVLPEVINEIGDIAEPHLVLAA